MVAEKSLSFRVSPQVGIELVFEVNTTSASSLSSVSSSSSPHAHRSRTAQQQHSGKSANGGVEPLEFTPEGIRTLGLFNFTGRLIFHRAPAGDDDSITFHDTSAATATFASGSEEDGAGGDGNVSLIRSEPMPPVIVEASPARPAIKSSSTSSSSLTAGKGSSFEANDTSSHVRFVSLAVGAMDLNNPEYSSDSYYAGSPPSPSTAGATDEHNVSTTQIDVQLNDDDDEYSPPNDEIHEPPLLDEELNHDDEHTPIGPQQTTSHEMLRVDDIAVAKLKARELHTRQTEKAAEFRRRKVLRRIQRATIPYHIRMRRSQSRSATTASSDFHYSDVSRSTPLHELCAQPNATLDDLFDCLYAYPSSLRAVDSWGRYPLHILGDNDVLLSTPQGLDAATVFASHLIAEFPRATFAADKDGFIPFCRILRDWIEWTNAAANAKPTTTTTAEPVSNGHHHEGDVADEDEGSDQHITPNRSKLKNFLYSGHHGMFSNRTAGAPGTTRTIHQWYIGSVKRSVFPRVAVWEEAEWCFSMLSTALDVLATTQGTNKNRATLRLPTAAGNINGTVSHRTQQDESRTLLVQALVKSLPRLFCTVLLVDDDGIDTRTRVLDMALFRRLLLCPEVVNGGFSKQSKSNWLIQMLNHGGIPAQRGVDFLNLISHTTLDDYTGGMSTLHRDWQAFYTAQHQVFEAVEQLKGTIASLVTLEQKETERAAATPVVWHVMGNKLSRPFVLGLVLIDLVLHLTLMVSFRSIVQTDASITVIDVVAEASIVYVISIHYLLRKFIEAWVLLALSMPAFRAYFSNVWTMFDTVAIVLTLVATILDTRNKESFNTGLNALVVGLLWIKVLGFLRVVNKQMSTFILALTQILYDIRLFMVVLAVCVFMFGDMFFITVSTKDDGQYCQENTELESGAIEDFCGSALESYLRVYSILLGDFELDDITETTGTTVLFVIFTVFGVVILLNVLIAVISDSYEKATMSGHLLFGRARVLYVAQNEALEDFLKPRGGGRERRRDHETDDDAAHSSEDDLSSSPERRRRKRASSALRWSVLGAILGTAVYTEIFLIGFAISLLSKNRWFLLGCALFVTLILFCALWVTGTFILDGVMRDLLPDAPERLYDRIGRVNSTFVKALSNKLFGLKKTEDIDNIKYTQPSAALAEEDWAGRIKYLESVMERMFVETRSELKSEILEMREEMHQHFQEGQFMTTERA